MIILIQAVKDSSARKKDLIIVNATKMSAKENRLLNEFNSLFREYKGDTDEELYKVIIKLVEYLQKIMMLIMSLKRTSCDSKRFPLSLNNRSKSIWKTELEL